MSLTKKDLVVHISKTHEVSQVVAAAILDTIAGVAQAEVKKGEPLVLPGIGRLTVTKRAARVGRNPQTGATLKIAAKKVVKFSPVTALREAAAGKAKAKKG